METCVKKLLIATALINTLIPAAPIYAMAGKNKEGQEEEEAKEARVMPITYQEILNELASLPYESMNPKREALLDDMIAAYGGIDAKNKYGATLLVNAVASGEVDTIKQLLDRGADINQILIHGLTVLIIAIECGKTNVVKLLLERGANVFTQDVWGNVPLSWAIVCGSTEIMQCLVFAAQEKQTKENNAKTVAEKREISAFVEGHGLNRCNNCYLSDPNILTIIEKAQQARDDLGAQNWSVGRLSQSDVLLGCGFPEMIEQIIVALSGDYHVDDLFLDELIDEAIAKRERKSTIQIECDSLGIPNKITQIVIALLGFHEEVVETAETIAASDSNKAPSHTPRGFII